jgi:hypothetical protein
MKFLTSEQHPITSAKPERVTLAEFTRLQSLGTTEPAAPPNPLASEPAKGIATRVAAAMSKMRSS